MRSIFDEMNGVEGALREPYAAIEAWLKATPANVLLAKREEAERLFRRIGITFAVYTEGGDPERLIPFDIIPRVIDGAEWDVLEKGLNQRVTALNAFLADVYGPREIVRAGKFPGRTGRVQPRLPKAHGGFQTAGRHLHAHRRHRSGAHRPRRILRAGRQLPHAVGRLLHAGRPLGDDAALP